MAEVYTLGKGEFAIAEVPIATEKYVCHYSNNETTVSMKKRQSHTLKKSYAISK